MSHSSPFDHWQDAVEPRHQPEADQETPVDAPGGLPLLFQFSQNSLQDYNDCARRFQLKYIDRQRWPAAETEPIEEHEEYMAMGTEFHLLVQRHILGIPAERLAPVDQPLADWWDAYLRNPPPDLPTHTRRPEVQLSTPLGAHRLLAKFDLLAIDPGERAVIVDWKTTRSRPPREVLAKRLQTRVYPYVLAEAGAHLFGGDLSPEQITLVYWFATAPANPEIFPYSSSLHAANHDDLSALMGEILARDDDIWPLTNDQYKCRYCVYRSLCDRGVEAGDINEAGLAMTIPTDAFDFDLDLDDLDAIAF